MRRKKEDSLGLAILLDFLLEPWESFTLHWFAEHAFDLALALMIIGGTMMILWLALI